MNPLILIYGTALIAVMGVSTILPVLPQMGMFFGLSEVSLGILLISFTLPGIFLAPVGGILADRLGRKAVLVPCLTIFALAGCAAGFSQTLEQFIVLRIIQGCGAACLGVLYNALIGDLYPQAKQRLRIMGFAAMTLSLSAALYPALGGFLGEWSWRYPMFVSLLALPLAIIALCTPLPTKAPAQNMQLYIQNALYTLRDKRIATHFLVTLCAFVILYGPLITYFPLLTVARFDANPARIGSIFSVAALGTTLVAGFLGPLGRVVPSRSLVYMGGACFTASMLLFPHMNSLYGYIVPVLLYGLGQGLVYPAVMTSLSGLAQHDNRGIVMAVNGTVLRLAQTIAPALCGLTFWLWGFAGVFFTGTVMGLGIILLTPHLYKSRSSTGER